jgi:hypothetical protein
LRHVLTSIKQFDGVHVLLFLFTGGHPDTRFLVVRRFVISQQSLHIWCIGAFQHHGFQHPGYCIIGPSGVKIFPLMGSLRISNR